MDQAQLLSLIGSLYDKFVADVSAKVQVNMEQLIKDIVQAKIDGLSDFDKSMITEIVRGEIENNIDLEEAIGDWMSNSFDIDDHIDVGDKVDDYLSDRLANMVREEVRDLSFSVSVDY